MKPAEKFLPVFPESREPELNLFKTFWDEAPEFELLPPWDEQQQSRKILDRLMAVVQATAGALVVFEPGRQRYLFRASAGLACSESAVCNLIWSHAGKFEVNLENELHPLVFSRHAFRQQTRFEFERQLGFCAFCFQPLMVDHKLIGGALLGNR
ncbi:MAG: hypothetical protein HGA76_08970, partial [Candidatus Firestonebacteria bacterium]|nr:hypothetical protein [Candidatus Firestonebacteria bacterium]